MIAIDKLIKAAVGGYFIPNTEVSEAAAELASLQERERKQVERIRTLEGIEKAADRLINECGWRVGELDPKGDYEIDGLLLNELAAALKTQEKP